jgi:hypothetical protein
LAGKGGCKCFCYKSCGNKVSFLGVITNEEFNNVDNLIHVSAGGYARSKSIYRSRRQHIHDRYYVTHTDSRKYALVLSIASIAVFVQLISVHGIDLRHRGFRQ